MTIRARQHRPGFVDRSDEPHTATVASVDELLAVPWIAEWGQDDLVYTQGQPTPTVRPFHRWSLADGHLLMAEFADGDHFWVVAHLTSDAPIPLPTWTITPTAQARVERWNRGDTSG